MCIQTWLKWDDQAFLWLLYLVFRICHIPKVEHLLGQALDQPGPLPNRNKQQRGSGGGGGGFSARWGPPGGSGFRTKSGNGPEGRPPRRTGAAHPTCLTPWVPAAGSRTHACRRQPNPEPGPGEGGVGTRGPEGQIFGGALPSLPGLHWLFRNAGTLKHIPRGGTLNPPLPPLRGRAFSTPLLPKKPPTKFMCWGHL